MNTVIMTGRLTRDPEARTTQSGSMVARYGIAVDRRYKKDGEPGADFFNCVCFGRTAEFAEKYLQKGTKVAITGRLNQNVYQDQNGKNVTSIDIIVEQHEFCESKKKDDFVQVDEGMPFDL